MKLLPSLYLAVIAANQTPLQRTLGRYVNLSWIPAADPVQTSKKDDQPTKTKRSIEIDLTPGQNATIALGDSGQESTLEETQENVRIEPDSVAFEVIATSDVNDVPEVTVTDADDDAVNDADDATVDTPDVNADAELDTDAELDADVEATESTLETTVKTTVVTIGETTESYSSEESDITESDIDSDDDDSHTDDSLDYTEYPQALYDNIENDQILYDMAGYDEYREDNEFDNTEHFYSPSEDRVVDMSLGHHKYAKVHKHPDALNRKAYKNAPSVFGNKIWKSEKQRFRASNKAITKELRREDREFSHAVRHSARKAERNHVEFVPPTQRSQIHETEVLYAFPDPVLYSRSRRSADAYKMLKQNAKGWKRASRAGVASGMLSPVQMKFNNLSMDKKVLIEKSKSFKKKGLTNKLINKVLKSTEIPPMDDLVEYYMREENKRLGLMQERRRMMAYRQQQYREKQLQAQMAYLNSDEYQEKYPFAPVVNGPTLETPRTIPPKPANYIPMPMRNSRTFRKGGDKLYSQLTGENPSKTEE